MAISCEFLNELRATIGFSRGETPLVCNECKAINNPESCVAVDEIQALDEVSQIRSMGEYISQPMPINVLK